jgi:hypothetical protein
VLARLAGLLPLLAVTTAAHAQCITSADCACNQVCVFPVCVPGCTNDSHCSAFHECIAGVCASCGGNQEAACSLGARCGADQTQECENWKNRFSVA